MIMAFQKRESFVIEVENKYIKSYCVKANIGKTRNE